jgi:small subunit ribosomal protein S20
MPNIASAKKRMRQDAVRRARNRSARSTLRTLTRKLRESIDAKKLDDCQAQFGELVQKLDKAAARSLIHANAAARTKSRLSKAIKALKS